MPSLLAAMPCAVSVSTPPRYVEYWYAEPALLYAVTYASCRPFADDCAAFDTGKSVLNVEPVT